VTRPWGVVLAFHAALAFTILTLAADWNVVSASGLGQPAPGVELIETRCVNGNQTARVTALCFNDKNHTLRVVDSPSPGSATLANTLSHAKAIGGVNGGYFHKDYRPVGLVVADGKTLHGFETAKLLSGLVAVMPDGRVAILRSGEYEPAKSPLLQALQCGPMLVEGGCIVPGLNDLRIARRTILAKGVRGETALIYMSSVTLADAARILALPSVLDTWKPRTAINLDGGSSSGLWTSKGFLLPEIARVRNFLGIFPR
jgi:uncharacterized protein YigE (DUF2233 family)